MCTQALVDLHGTPSKCKVLGLSTLNHFISCFVILILCAIVQTLTLKEQVFCSNAYKQTLTIENEKSESFQVNEVLSTINNVDGQKLRTKLGVPPLQQLFE